MCCSDIYIYIFGATNLLLILFLPLFPPFPSPGSVESGHVVLFDPLLLLACNVSDLGI